MTRESPALWYSMLLQGAPAADGEMRGRAAAAADAGHWTQGPAEGRGQPWMHPVHAPPQICQFYARNKAACSYTNSSESLMTIATTSLGDSKSAVQHSRLKGR